MSTGNPCSSLSSVPLPSSSSPISVISAALSEAETDYVSLFSLSLSVFLSLPNKKTAAAAAAPPPDETFFGRPCQKVHPTKKLPVQRVETGINEFLRHLFGPFKLLKVTLIWKEDLYSGNRVWPRGPSAAHPSVPTPPPPLDESDLWRRVYLAPMSPYFCGSSIQP